jgi:Uma2 family endonuclease
MASAVVTRLLTMEEFMDLPEDASARKMELCDGRVIYMSQPGDDHGRLAGNVYDFVKPFVQTHSLGVVRFDTGFVLRRDPDRVVAPDVAYIAHERLDPARDLSKAIPAAPTLAVEVVSPNDTDHDVGAKVLEYLDAGTSRVWVVRRDSRTVTVYRDDRTARIFAEPAVLDSDAAGFTVEGFNLPVAAVFA